MEDRILTRTFFVPMFRTVSGTEGRFHSDLSWSMTGCRKDGVYVGSINPAENPILNGSTGKNNALDDYCRWTDQLRSGQVPGLEPIFQVGNRPLYFWDESSGDSRVEGGRLVRKTPGKANWALNSPIEELLDGYLQISEFLGRRPSAIELASTAIIGPFWDAFREKEMAQYLERQAKEAALVYKHHGGDPP